MWLNDPHCARPLLACQRRWLFWFSGDPLCQLLILRELEGHHDRPARFEWLIWERMRWIHQLSLCSWLIFFRKQWDQPIWWNPFVTATMKSFISDSGARPQTHHTAPVQILDQWRYAVNDALNTFSVTGMTWSAFVRGDCCQYSYLIPSNMSSRSGCLAACTALLQTWI